MDSEQTTTADSVRCIAGLDELAETWRRRLWEYDNAPKKGDDPVRADQLAKCFLALVAVMEGSSNDKGQR